MRIRIIATSLLISLLATFVWGQKEVTLQMNSIIKDAYETTINQLPFTPNQALGQEKFDCTGPTDDVIIVLESQSRTMQLDIDTFNLGGNGAYNCMDCGDLSFGIATVLDNPDGSQTDFIFYNASAGVDAGMDTLHVQYCNADTCSSIQEIVYLVRRAGRHVFPATINIGQEETIQVEAANDFPGELVCNFFADCPDNYEGRDQLVYFNDYSMPVNEVVYHSSRFAGLDSVCVVLCDEFAICDTTHFSFRIEVPSISYPFYDDFSYDSAIPDQNLWLDKEVFLNKTLAIEPPSVGVATLDGIDFRGRAYNTGFGASDRLTSAYIDIPASANTPTLSFWAQRGGLADRPELKDSLVLQFKSLNGDWVSMLKLAGLLNGFPLNRTDTFRFHAVPLESDFQHDRFQFRFVGYGDGNGFRDNWHVDYVCLDNNPAADSIFNDIAFTKEPDFILNNYTSMPWRHFQPIAATELKSTIEISLYNHFASGQNMIPSSLNMEETATGINPLGTTPTLFNGTEGNIVNGISVNRSYSLMGDATGFANVWSDFLPNMSDNAFDGIEELSFKMEYEFQNNSQSSADFVGRNDRVSRNTVFSDYFAYDDGTAETGLETTIGTQVAVKYTLSVDDTLRGVQIQFPITEANIENQEFRLKIWIGELDDTPDYSMDYVPAYASTFFDTLQGFTSYQLLEDDIASTLVIPAGDFYVGWQQLTGCSISECIAVGYDRNRPQGRDFIYTNGGNGWSPISNIRRGALMIRPVVGGSTPILPTALDIDPTELTVKVFPNPGRGVVYLQSSQLLSEKSELKLYNSAGLLLLNKTFEQELNISDLPAGIYFLQIYDPVLKLIARERLVIID